MRAGTYYKAIHMSVIDHFNAQQFAGILKTRYAKIQTPYADIQKICFH
jgi:hypothetical protein